MHLVKISRDFSKFSLNGSVFFGSWRRGLQIANPSQRLGRLFSVETTSCFDEFCIMVHWFNRCWSTNYFGNTNVQLVLILLTRILFLGKLLVRCVIVHRYPIDSYSYSKVHFEFQQTNVWWLPTVAVFSLFTTLKLFEVPLSYLRDNARYWTVLISGYFCQWLELDLII